VLDAFAQDESAPNKRQQKSQARPIQKSELEDLSRPRADRAQHASQGTGRKGRPPPVRGPSVGATASTVGVERV